MDTKSQEAMENFEEELKGPQCHVVYNGPVGITGCIGPGVYDPSEYIKG